MNTVVLGAGAGRTEKGNDTQTQTSIVSDYKVPANDMDCDPLLALRHAIKSKSPITYLIHGEPAPTLLAATHLSLSPAITLQKSSPTRYTKPGVSNSSSAADVYTLEAVYLAWLLRDAPGAEYMRQARESGLTVGFVSVTERKSVVEWLEGKVADLERISPLASGQPVPRLPSVNWR